MADSWPLSAREAAALLGVSERTVRRAIARAWAPDSDGDRLVDGFEGIILGTDPNDPDSH